MSTKDRDMFDSQMKKTDKLDDSIWRATTAKRQSIIIPKGVQIWDTDLKVMFVGDGVTEGGVSDGTVSEVRVVQLNAASSGGVTPVGATASTSIISGWDDFQYLRTGDSVRVSGTDGATVPGGLANDTVYYIKKTDDDGTGIDEGNTGTNVYFMSTREAAVSGASGDNVAITSSGTQGWTLAVSGVGLLGEKVLHLEPCLTSGVAVFLPDADATTTVSALRTIKKDVEDQTITILEVDASGNPASTFLLNGVAGTASLTGGHSCYLTLYPVSSGWHSIGSGNV